MKKLKNIFLLGFLICLSIFIGINISFFAYSYNSDFTYNLVTSDVQDNGMKIEKNYFKSKYFNQKVMNSILTNLKYSVIDSENEDKYSSKDIATGSYYYDYNEGEFNWNSIQERIYNIMRGTAFTCDIDDNADDFNDNADDNCKWYNRHFISNLQIISEGQSNYEETYYIGKPLAYKNNKNNNFISFEL